MDSYLNQPFLAKRAKYARWGSLLGMGALLGGLIVIRTSPMLSYLFLGVGLVCASVGSYYANRYVREPRADQVFDRALASLDRRYAMYHYYLPSHHVIASHYGLTVLLPRSQEGEIRYDGGRWRHKAGWRKLLQLFGEPSLSKPDRHLEEEMRWVKKWVDELMSENDIPVTGAVVFTNARAQVEASEAPVPVLTPDELADFMKEELKSTSILSTALQKELRRSLDEFVSAR